MESSLSNRKKAHIDLASEAQTGFQINDSRFDYEPLLSSHQEQVFQPFPFLGKQMQAPLWISSMTGGTKAALQINKNLARAAREFGLGMGLGSCRILLEGNKYPEHFLLRPIIGDTVPFYANLGISQIENAVLNNHVDPIEEMIDRLEADGLIIHVNPLQEWLQPEGDRLKEKPIHMIEEFVKQVKFPIVVKEVGQGMGPASLAALLKLPLQAIDFAAFGGTNFAKLELLRTEQAFKQMIEPISRVGNTASDMLDQINQLVNQAESIRVKELIISGGIRDFLDGYYFIKKSKLPAVYGQASAFLKHASGNYEELKEFVEAQLLGLQMAYTYLSLK